MRRALAAIGLFCIALTAHAQDLASIEKRVSVKKLANGLTVIVMERPVAPVFSFLTFVDAGSAEDPPGATGLAHMFEHMAFKGSDTVGTTNYAAEQAALAKVEKAYAAYNSERRRTMGRDEAKVAQLEKAWRDAIAEADKFVVQNEFAKIISGNGGTNLNAITSADQTVYFYSLPSNRVELWALLESDRFRRPVYREFYKERDVVMEERRQRVESSPIGRLIEQFTNTAFSVHPYQHTASAGLAADLRSFSATEADAFFKKYYVPSNMVVALVGDVRAAEVMPVIEKYFGCLPAAPQPEPLRVVEPPSTAERVVTIREATQPFYFEGYKRPPYSDPDSPVFAVITDLLSDDRVSRLSRSLIRDKKIAAYVESVNLFPGPKYTNVFGVFAVPTPGHTANDMSAAIRAEFRKLIDEDVPAEELDSLKTRAKAALLRQLDNNQGLANQLAVYQSRFGDWRELFRQIERIEKVTAADIRRVAGKYFVASGRTVGMIESEQPQGGAQ